ncbi:hypothetical protein [Streptomyces sp. NPDC093261]|uniref:hypothetical protein n=1 Tax=Streptomyces sp. NPDC093261 TaxID=3366037 RepID=UPI00380E3DC6
MATAVRRYPADAAERAALRRCLRVEAIERAMESVPQGWASLNCADGKHAPAGCQNSGSTCLCDCHDDGG